MFFLLSGFVLAYAEMTRPATSPAAQLTQLQYTWRRLRKIYPPYLFTLLISMLQIEHTSFQWRTLPLNLFLLQTWVPLVDESNPWDLISTAGSWVGVAWFLSALLLYWQFLRPAARLAQRMSFKMAMCSLLALWLWTMIMLMIWKNLHIVSGYFMSIILHEGPLGYVHVFLSGVVLARILVLMTYVDAETRLEPDPETERLSLGTREEIQLPCIFKFGTLIALGCYLPLFWIQVQYDTPILAICHNGGLLPMMCLLLLSLSLDMDLLAPALGSGFAKMLGRISYCQYIIQGNVRHLFLKPLHQHFWLVLPVFLVVLAMAAYLMEWLMSSLVDWMCQESSDFRRQPSPALSESTEESESEDPKATDIFQCGL